MISRKGALASLAATPLALAFATPARASTVARFREIEARIGGRLGVAYLDVRNGTEGGYRRDERFPMCSTFKFLLVACTLHRVDRGREQLDERVAYSQRDVLEYAPVTTAHLSEGAMLVRDLCAAAVSVSDNTAANLLLARAGGPGELTSWLRSHGDATTRLDRNEPDLNESLPGDPRDTTSPASMAANMRRFVFGSVLSPTSRALLQQWLIGCTTGRTLLRAGLPTGAIVGDKTGTGGPNNTHGDSTTRNDVAFVLDASRTPQLFIAVYTTGVTETATERDAAIASVGRLFA